MLNIYMYAFYILLMFGYTCTADQQLLFLLLRSRKKWKLLVSLNLYFCYLYSSLFDDVDVV